MFYPPLKNKYKTEGVVQLQNLQGLGNNHVNLKRKLFLFFYLFILQKKEFATFFL